MSEKRFTDVAKTPREELECEKKYLYEYSMFWECNDGSKCQIIEDDVVRLLNEQQATINELQAQLREKEREERLYANEILELRETNKEHIKFKSLGGNY